MHRELPVAGEGDIKTALAMKLQISAEPVEAFVRLLQPILTEIP